MRYLDYLEKARSRKAFAEHIAGDVGSFRYPHASSFESLFRYDGELRCWLSDAESGEGEHATCPLRAFAAEDITAYEFLSPAARQIHCLDMICIPYSEDLRERAFSEVCSLYEDRNNVFGKANVRTARAADLPVREEFSYLHDLYHGVEQVPIRFVQFGGCETWPFGSVLKGTDVVIADENALNFGQDMLHALYHLNEGIPGVNDDNCFVREIWAPVPALYALQLAEGRLSRRIRLKPSPHPIHFTDYIFLRAYLGQGYAPVDAGNACSAHPALAVVEPSIRLMNSALGEVSAWDRNRILADAVLADKVDELIVRFEQRYGPGSFSAIFDTYALYDKRRRALEYVGEAELDEIMFGGPALIPTDVSPETVERLWKDEALRANPDDALGAIGLG